MKCPTCKKNDYSEEFKPFCSKRCKEIDLGNWFGEKYSIAESYVLDDKKIKNDDDCKN